MNSETLNRFSYHNVLSKEVSLKEYLFSYNAKTMEKYVLFQFHNATDREVTSLNFDLVQLDRNQKEMQVVPVSFQALGQNQKSDFVPPFKIQIDASCQSIELRHFSFELAEPLVAEPVKKSKFSKKKMNKIHKIRFLPILLFLLILLAGLGYTMYAYLQKYQTEHTQFTDADFIYNKESDSEEVSIVKYQRNEKKVTIPKEIYGYPITAIEEEAFLGKQVTSVVAESKVLEIGDRAFSSCSGLKSFTGNTVWRIGEEAFNGCTNLTELDVDSIDEIGSEAFENCVSLTTFSSSTVQQIGDGAFRGCTSLTEISVPNAVVGAGTLADTPTLSSVNISTGNVKFFGDIFDCQNTALPETLREVVLNADRISKSFFAELQDYSLFRLLNKNVKFEYPAFENATFDGYEDTGTYEMIDGQAISWIPSEIVVISADTKIKSLSVNVFALTNCREIQIDAPLSLPEGIFADCENLESVVLSERVSLGTSCLADTVLKELYLPKSGGNFKDYLKDGTIQKLYLTGTGSLSPYYFEGCNIEELTISDDIRLNASCLASISGLEKLTISNVGGLNGFGSFPDLKEVTLVLNPLKTSIDSLAFHSLPKLVKINLPENVTSIGSYAFSDLESLQELPSFKNVRIASPIVSQCPSLARLELQVTHPITGSVIGEGCQRLGFLKITTAYQLLPMDQLDLSITALTHLSIDFSGTLFNTKGFLKGCDHLEYLEMPFVNQGILGDLFSSQSVEKEDQLYVVPSTLKTVVINRHGNVFQVASGYFYGLLQLDAIDIVSSNITTIETDAVTNCSNLKNLFIPAISVHNYIDGINRTSFDGSLNVLYASTACIFGNSQVRSYDYVNRNNSYVISYATDSSTERISVVSPFLYAVERFLPVTETPVNVTVVPSSDSEVIGSYFSYMGGSVEAKMYPRNITADLYEEKETSLAYENWDGTYVSASSDIVPRGKEREGYAFLYWEFNGSLFDFTETVTEPKTLTARYEALNGRTFLLPETPKEVLGEVYYSSAVSLDLTISARTDSDSAMVLLTTEGQNPEFKVGTGTLTLQAKIKPGKIYKIYTTDLMTITISESNRQSAKVQTSVEFSSTMQVASYGFVPVLYKKGYRFVGYQKINDQNEGTLFTDQSGRLLEKSEEKTVNLVAKYLPI